MGIASKIKVNWTKRLRLTKSTLLKPDYAEAHYNIGVILKGTIFKKPNKRIQKQLFLCLTKRFMLDLQISH